MTGSAKQSQRRDYHSSGLLRRLPRNDAKRAWFWQPISSQHDTPPRVRSYAVAAGVPSLRFPLSEVPSTAGVDVISALAKPIDFSAQAFLNGHFERDPTPTLPRKRESEFGAPRGGRRAPTEKR